VAGSLGLWALDAQNEPMAAADSWRGIWPATCVTLAHWRPLAGEWRWSRSQQQIATFDFKVNTGSASRPQSLGLRSQRPLQPGVVLFDFGRNNVVSGDIFPPFSHIPRFAVARVLSRGMWGMRGMFLAGISIGILASSCLRHGSSLPGE
jgi:hypothetical protein